MANLVRPEGEWPSRPAEKRDGDDDSLAHLYWRALPSRCWRLCVGTTGGYYRPCEGDTRRTQRVPGLACPAAGPAGIRRQPGVAPAGDRMYLQVKFTDGFTMTREDIGMKRYYLGLLLLIGLS